jgi:hypothetical protein
MVNIPEEVVGLLVFLSIIGVIFAGVLVTAYCNIFRHSRQSSVLPIRVKPSIPLITIVIQPDDSIIIATPSDDLVVETL